MQTLERGRVQKAYGMVREAENSKTTQRQGPKQAGDETGLGKNRSSKRQRNGNMTLRTILTEEQSIWTGI